MSITTKNQGNTVIVKDLADLASQLSSLTDGTIIEFNGIGCTLFTGTSAPTTATKAFSTGDIYVDTTNTKFYICSAITLASSVYTFTWSEIVKQSDLSDVIRYSVMSLTDAQKTQARSNIGAVALAEYNSSVTPVDDVLYYVAEV